MQTRDLLKKEVIWLNNTGKYLDVVISSRIRFARNLPDYPFKGAASEVQQKEIIKFLRNEFLKNNYLKNSVYFDLKRISNIERYFLVERHIISREHAEFDGERGVIVSKGETLSIMLNEEDHVRLQSVFSGFQLVEAWRLASKIDNDIQKKIKFAYSDEWGYLTACPTNVGTGLRASVMMHLPCLVLTKQINKVLDVVAKLGLTVRGLYGEGTAAAGCFFQISNQVTLGLSEEEILDNIEKVCLQIIKRENDAKEMIYKKETIILEDRIMRAYGLLKNARIISFSDTINLLSSIRLGISLGFIKDVSLKSINELFLLTQPAHVHLIENKKMVDFDRDVKRAELIRDKLK